MAKGYWIARVDVSDAEAYQRYRGLNAVAFAKFGARFMVRGPATLVGMGEARQHQVVLEFADLATAIACYDSPEYQAAKAVLAGVGKVDLVIADGYDGPQPA
jgi:uncharacterized protein (DUF1330 family)